MANQNKPSAPTPHQQATENAVRQMTPGSQTTTMPSQMGAVSPAARASQPSQPGATQAAVESAMQRFSGGGRK